MRHGLIGAALAVSTLVVAPIATAAAPTVAPSAPSQPVVSPLGANGYVAITPARLLDTRPGAATIDGIGLGAGPFGPATTRDVQVAGRAGVPTAGVEAVVLHVTATNQTANTFVTAWPSGQPKPPTSTLNPAPGGPESNLVVLDLGPTGTVSLANEFGSVDLIVDVAGWFPTGAAFTGVAPDRLLDTRTTGTPIGPGQSVQLQVGGRGGVPTTGVSAVAVNITAANATANTFFTVHPTGAPRPTTSSLNILPGVVGANLAITELGTDGKITIYNDSGTTDAIVDVTGWFGVGPDFAPIPPLRIVDTRLGNPIGPGETRRIPLAGLAGIPTTGVGTVMVNLTAVDATAQTYLTVFPSGTSRPITSDLNPRPGRNFANQILAKLGPDGSISVYNDAGEVDVLIDVAGWVPSAETAVADAATIPQDSPATTINVLANDADPDGDPTVIASATQPANGTVVVAPGGKSLTYRPNPGYCNLPPGTALDTFTYRLGNGLSAPVTVTVPCLDISPVAVADSTTVAEDAAPTAVPVLTNDTDVDGGPKTVASVTQPAHGTVVITGAGTGLTYAPAADYCGADSFTYTLNGGSTATVTVTVTCVDDPPTQHKDNPTVVEDSSANPIDVLANDTDVDGGPKSIATVTQPANGTVVITGGGTGLTYQPNVGYCNNPPGTTVDTFTYTLAPGGSTGPVDVTVDCDDDAPVALNDSALVAEDSAATAIDVLANDPDLDGGPKSVASVTQPANGTVVITGGGIAVTYAPNANYCNTPPGTTLDTFTYTLAPGSSTATVIVSVGCTDDTPVAVADSSIVTEDAAATAIPVLTNDTDIDGGPKSVASVTQPASGAVVITGGGTGLTYAPAANYCNTPPGTTLDTFTYTLAPGTSTATVTVTVTCVDDAPVAVADSATVTEDAAVAAVDVLTNDTDIDGGPRSIASVTQPANGTVAITGGGTGLTYAPAANYCNTPPGTTLDTFTYTLSGGSSATVSMTVTCVDDPPGAAADSATVAEDSGATAIDVLANDTDIDGGAKSVTSVTQPANGTVVITGGGTGLTYAPAANYCNTPPGTTLDTFTYTLTPGGTSATVTVTVTCVDDPPVAVADSATVVEDSGANAVAVLANDTDIDGGPKTIASAGDPANGTVVVAGDGSGLTYAPDANYCGPDSFGYTLNGGSSATVSMTVTCVNDPPVMATPPTYNAQANMALTVAAGSGLLVGATDPDGPTTLAISDVSVTAPAGGSVTPNLATGAFTIELPPGATGAVTFTYTICDDGIPAPSACSAPITATVTVAGPVIWFVDDTAPAGGNGTLSKPFQTLAAAVAAIGADTNERVFLFDGTYAGGISLNTGGWLIGQPVTGAGPGSTFDDVMSIAPPAGTQPRPAIASGGPVTVGGNVALGTNSQVKGVAIVTAGGGLSGSLVTGVVVSQTSVASTGGAALSFTSVGGAVTLASLTQTGGTIGIDIIGSTASVAVGSGAIANTGVKGVSLDGGSGAFTFGGTVNTSAGRSVDVVNRTGTSTLAFSGAITATGGTGVTITGNTATTTVNFTGALALSTATNVAFTATGGQVTATDATSTLATTTATALNVNGATIGAGGLRFRSISAGTGASGPANGIVLQNTGTAGGLSVLGVAATNDSGGTIQRTSGAGISLTNTKAPSFNEMRIDTTAGSGIAGTAVDGFTLTNSTVSNSGTLATTDTSNLGFNTSATGIETNLSGAVTITGNTLSNAAWHGIDIVNHAGTISAATITGNSIVSNTAAAASLGSGIRIQALGSISTAASITTANLSANDIQNFPSGGGIVVLAGNVAGGGAPGTYGSSGSPITIASNAIRGQSAVNRMGTSAIIATVSGVGTGFFTIANNGTVGTPLGNTAGTTILAGANDQATATFAIANNVISANNEFASNGIGIGTGINAGGPTSTPTLNANVSGNAISNTDGNGILAVARGAAGTLNAKIQNNTVAAPLAGVRQGIRIDAANATSTADKVCLNISGNTSAGVGGAQGIGLRLQSGPSNVFGVNGMAATATPGVENYVTGLNPAGGGTLLISATTGFTNCSLP